MGDAELDAVMMKHENEVSKPAPAQCESYKQEQSGLLLISHEPDPMVIPKDVLNTCQDCKGQFETLEILNIHLHIHHKDGQFPTSCPVCQHVFAPGRKLSKSKQKIFVSHINEHIKAHVKEYKLKKYSCTVCGRPMQKEYQLKTHMRVHTNEKPFACNMCDKSFKQRAGLLTHMNSAHMKITFDCQVCHRPFSTKSSIMRHMKKIHAKGLTVSCVYCNKFVKDEASMQQHIDSVHGNRIKLKSCYVCGLELPIMSMRKHIRTHRARGEIVDRKCLLCKAEFADQRSYGEHVNDHIQFTTSDLKEALKNKAFHCRYCSKIYQSRYRLLSHMTHHIYQPLGMKFRHSILDVDEDWETQHHKRRRKKGDVSVSKCKKCKKIVSLSKNDPSEEFCVCLQVNSVTLHKCKICQRTFHNRRSLSKHHLAHQCEVEDYKSSWTTHICKICKKPFKEFTSFCKHIHKHKMCRKYKCRICHKCFIIKERRDIHVKLRKCRKFLASIERSMNHACQHCSKKFFTKEHLDTHSTYHSIEYMVCRFCGLDFKEFPLIRDHMRTSHPGEKVAYCQYCDIGFDTLKDIKIHMFDTDHLMLSDSEIKRMSDFDNLELLEGIVQIKEEDEELVY